MEIRVLHYNLCVLRSDSRVPEKNKNRHLLCYRKDSSLSIETEYFYKFIIKIRLKKVYKKYVHIYGIMLYNRGKEQIWGKERRAWNRHTNTPIK